MLDNTNFNQIVKDAANFVYCYQNHKEINDAEKEACKQFLDYLNISFDESKALESIKSVIYDRLKTDKAYLAKGDKGKTYNNMLKYFEGKATSEGEPYKLSFPKRDSLIQICFDFDICDKDRINWLFDKMYYDRLYLKDGRDFVIYCCLTKPTIRAEIEAAYPNGKDCLDCIDGFIKEEKINAKRIHIKAGFDNGASKFTSEIYDEIEDGIETLDDIRTYYRDNMPVFSQQRQYTVKEYLSKMSKLADKGLLEEIFFSDFDDSDDNRSPLYKNLWDSFYAYSKGGKGGHDDKITYLWDKVAPLKSDDKSNNPTKKRKKKISEEFENGEEPVEWEEFKSEYNNFSIKTMKALEPIDYLIPRGTFLLMCLFVIAAEAEKEGLNDVDWANELNERLDNAGFALLNEDGVLIDKIASLYIETFGFYTETIEDILQFISFVSRLESDCPFDN